VDAWSYQGIEAWLQEDPSGLLDRLGIVEGALGIAVGFEAVGLFWAPMTKGKPPRFSQRGQLRRFLHVTWQRSAPHAWSVLLYVGERDQRALLSAFSGAGFLARDVDIDGHPREGALVAAFTTQAEDFSPPLKPAPEAEPETLQARWLATVEQAADRLRSEGFDPEAVRHASHLVRAHRVRFEHGWYLKAGPWRSRYLVHSADDNFALAVAQESLCTCASQHPDALRLVMPSDNCVHHLAARLVDDLIESSLAATGNE